MEQPPNNDQHRREFEQFKAVLEAFNATRIEERLSILEAFLATEEHIEVAELEKILNKDYGSKLRRDFIKETMDMFCQFGFAQKISFENQQPRYEHHHVGTHHDHFICTRCGRIQEFSNPGLERLQVDIARGFRFHPLQHKMEIYGLCSECMAQRESSLQLSMAANGEHVKIIEIAGGREIRKRLTDMGINIGSCVEMINNNAAGQVLVVADGIRLALNRGMARKIQVKHSCLYKNN